MFGQIAFGEGFVRGGADSISRLHIFEVAEPMVSVPPGCWLHHQAASVEQYLPESAAAGVDVDYFVMPPIAPGADTPVFGGGTFAAASRDRPEIREFLRELMSPEWGTLAAANAGSTFLPFNSDFDVSRCRAAELSEAVNAVRVRLCQETRDAVAAGQWRLDASDQMPPEVGALTEDGGRGAFFQGMIDYVDHGPDNLDQILANIEAAWPP
jgi:alpha-glucoside transport system substrate-binding protein